LCGSWNPQTLVRRALFKTPDRLPVFKSLQNQKCPRRKRCELNYPLIPWKDDVRFSDSEQKSNEDANVVNGDPDCLRIDGSV
jgi:hypothetical protein